MKNTVSNYINAAFCLCVCLSMCVCLWGCRGAGETASEVNIRHKHIIRTNTSMIQDDVDALMLLDKPSKLSDKMVR